MKVSRVVWLSMVAMAGAAVVDAGLAGAVLSPLPVKTSGADEFLPAAGGPWFAWTQSSHATPNRYSAFVQRGSGARIKVNPAGTKGQSGGIDGRTLVYAQGRRNFARDIRKFNLRTHRRSNFPAKVSTRWDEYHPTISGEWVLFTRYFDTTNTTKVLLFNVRTGALRTLGSERGRHRFVYSGQVNGDYATWGRAPPDGQSDVFLYQISSRTNVKIPRPVFAQYRPTVASDGTVYYVRSGNACGASAKLVRYPLGGPATIVYDFPAGIDSGYGYVQERADGSLHLFFAQANCQKNRLNIYKVIDSHALSISKAGTGTGSVTSQPAGIACGTECQATFHGGATVTLTATADTGSVFGGWSDPSCGLNAACSVIVDGDVSLTATFDPSP